MPRRLTASPLEKPDPPLADEAIRLEPLGRAHAGPLVAVVRDPDVRRFTFVPSDAGESFARSWVRRYEEGWLSGERAGFAVVEAGGEPIGFASIVRLDLPAREGEIGYALGAAARGRGAATRAVSLLSDWGFDGLGLERLELRIDRENRASERVAERCGYRLDGVLRSKHFKDGLRTDVGIWSRLRVDRVSG